MNKITFSVDVEKDLHSNSYLGVSSGLKKFEKLCDKHKIKPVLFVTADCIIKHPIIFKKLNKKGWEISLHGYSHKRFDELNFNEKEEELKKSIQLWKKKLGFLPRGFRAPQHSIDSDTLDLLESYNFIYDSSYAPLNAFQLIFFPSKIKIWFKQFFSRLNPYKIRVKLEERPTSALIIPFVSFSLRFMPKPIIYLYTKIIASIYEKPIFYAHSWDFIELKESRIDKMVSHERFLDKLDYLMSIK